MESIKITSRELEVLYLLAHEFTTREVASKLYISPHTVISHRKNLLNKLNVRNTAGMIRAAFELCIFQDLKPFH